MCGYTTAGSGPNSEGFIGYFYIADILNNNVGLYLSSAPFITNPGGKILQFDELEVYHINGALSEDISLVAIGKAEAQNPPKVSMVFNAVGYSYMPWGWTYADGITTEETEEITQISVTDDYVVTGSTIYNNYDAVKLRVYNKYGTPDIFDGIITPGSGLFDDVYFFPSNSATTNIDFPIDRNWQMTFTRYNEIAIAAFWQPTTQHSPTMYSGVLLHVYDIASMLSSGNPPLYSVYDQTPHYRGTARIADLRFNKSSSLLHLLMTTDNPAIGIESVATEIDYPPFSSAMQFHYIQGVEFDHIDNFNSNSNGISIGRFRQTQDLNLYAFPVSTTPNCSSWGSLSYDKPKKFMSKTQKLPLEIYRDLFGYNVFSRPVGERVTFIKCQR